MPLLGFFNRTLPCEACGRRVDRRFGLIRLADGSGICRDCRDAVRPTCPACRGRLPLDDPPDQPAKLTCPRCKTSLRYEPRQQIWDSAFVTEAQAGLAGYVMRLDDWDFARGSLDDFLRTRVELGLADAPMNESTAVKIIWRMLEDNLRNLRRQNRSATTGQITRYREQLQQLQRSLENDVRRMAKRAP